MGSKSINGKCLLSGMIARDINLNNSNWAGYEYEIKIGDKRNIVLLPEQSINWIKTEEFKKVKHIIAGLIRNAKFFSEDFEIIEEYRMIEERLSQLTFPKTPQQLQENLFYNLFLNANIGGSEYTIAKDYERQTYYNYYFRDWEEIKFYLESLREQDLIKLSSIGSIWKIKITYKGLNYAISLSQSGDKSNKCFIAMSFKDETKSIRVSIKRALEKTGFEPIIVDEQHLDSDKTINDEIINSIRKSKFCISDFTYHSNGVYFESGYALGQGKKVIYTCRADEFANAHFDIRPLQHIIYKDDKQLEKELINKIEVWIK